jgi:hypothetical protein
MTSPASRTNSFEIKQGDTSPRLETNLYDGDGVALDLTAAISVTLTMELAAHPRTKVLNNAAASFTADATGSVWYQWVAGNTATAGKYNIEWRVTFPLGQITTVPSRGYDIVDVTPVL